MNIDLEGTPARGEPDIQATLPLDAPPLPPGVPLLPVRMVNEYVYCPRLAYLEWVQGEWAESADTVEGRQTTPLEIDRLRAVASCESPPCRRCLENNEIKHIAAISCLGCGFGQGPIQCAPVGDAGKEQQPQAIDFQSFSPRAVVDISQRR